MKIILIFLLCLLTWACTPLIYNVMISFYDARTLTNRGVFGDSFGVVTSLFSLFSFIAVLYVLQQTQHKDGEKERPFVLTLFDEHSVPAKIFANEHNQTFSLLIQVNVKNYSDYLAHSLKISCWIECNGNKFGNFNAFINHPITSSENALPAISIELDTKENMEVLDALTGAKSVYFKFQLVYKNTSNHTFTTLNVYSLAIADADFESINCLRRSEYKEEHWGGKRFISCKFDEYKDFVS